MKLAHQININVIKFQVCGVCTTFINQFRQKKKQLLQLKASLGHFFLNKHNFCTLT